MHSKWVCARPVLWLPSPDGINYSGYSVVVVQHFCGRAYITVSKCDSAHSALNTPKTQNTWHANQSYSSSIAWVSTSSSWHPADYRLEFLACVVVMSDDIHYYANKHNYYYGIGAATGVSFLHAVIASHWMCSFISPSLFSVTLQLLSLYGQWSQENACIPHIQYSMFNLQCD